ncbi:MAG TPA: multidrug efflux SMR transporter [Bacteroidales bacterium]|nr:multidrug efflux SMR transporter [Bacteroidales bacterium]
MAWFYLLIAGVFEVGWALGMKYTEGFTRFWPTLGVLVVMGLSVYFLSLAVRFIDLGTAYAVWTGIGIAGTAIAGMIWFGESTSILRLLFIFLILASVVGLRLIAK